MDREQLTAQEKFVLKQVERGAIANLKKQFGDNEADRCLRANFLEALLTDDITDGLKKVKPHRRGIRIADAIIDGYLDLGNVEVSHIVAFERCIFKEKMKFQDARFTRYLYLKNCQFYQEADFQRLIVDINLFCNNAVFHGPVDFGGAEIGRQFIADGSTFKNAGKEVNFNGLKVGQIASIENTVFYCAVDFVNSDIGIQFNAEGAKFLGEIGNNEAKFNNMKVGESASFRGAIFNGPAYFDFAQIGGSLSLDSLRTNSGGKETTFHSTVKFGGVNIGGQLVANAAKFEQDADFGGLEVTDLGIFKNSFFKGKVSWNYAHLKGLEISYTDTKLIDKLDLSNARVERELILTGIDINHFHAQNLKATGSATLTGLSIKEECDLRYSSFQVLNFDRVTWPQNKEKILLEGLTYQSINAGDGKEDWRRLLTWVKGSRFNTQNYSQLEAYFSRCGHRGRADEVFISGKREAANRLSWGKKWLTRIFWGGLAGYGRKPWQVLYVIFPLVALGTFLFAPEFTAKSLESYGWLNQMKQNHPWAIQFLVSLDRFLPGVDLGLAKEWSPACVGLFTFAYWYFLKLTGWITIPIALAAIYTRIK